LGGDPHDLVALSDQELRYKNRAGYEYLLHPINDADRQAIQVEGKK
jgi:hypothetical protein